MNSINSIPAYCINLDYQKEKWDSVKERFDKVGFKNVERISAVVGVNVDIKDKASILTQYNLKNKYRCQHAQLPSLGAIGCSLSHIKIWQQMIDNNINYAYIFEDDVMFDDDFVNKLNKYLEEDQVKKADIFYFGYQHLDHKLKLCIGSQGYLISNNGAKILLKNAFPLECNVDIYMYILNKLDLINIVFPEKTIATQFVYKTSTTQTLDCYKCYLPSKSYITLIYLIIISITIYIIIKNIKKIIYST
jgi:glycosyl transferase family 25